MEEQAALIPILVRLAHAARSSVVHSKKPHFTTSWTPVPAQMRSASLDARSDTSSHLLDIVKRGVSAMSVVQEVVEWRDVCGIGPLVSQEREPLARCGELRCGER